MRAAKPYRCAPGGQSLAVHRLVLEHPLRGPGGMGDRQDVEADVDVVHCDQARLAV